MPNVYRGIGRVAHLAPLPIFLFPRDVYDKIRLMQGFHGNDNLHDLANHAVYNDTRAALIQQEVMITQQFNKESAMHNIDECIDFDQSVMDSLSKIIRSPKRGLRLLIGEGTLDQHADNPHERTRVERLALSDIAQQMTIKVGGLLDKDIFELQALGQTA